MKEGAVLWGTSLKNDISGSVPGGPRDGRESRRYGRTMAIGRYPKVFSFDDVAQKMHSGKKPSCK